MTFVQLAWFVKCRKLNLIPKCIILTILSILILNNVYIDNNNLVVDQTINDESSSPSHNSKHVATGIPSPKMRINPIDEDNVPSYVQNPSFESTLDLHWTIPDLPVTQETSPVMEGNYSAFFNTPSDSSPFNRTLEQTLRAPIPLDNSPVINTWVYPTGVGSYGGQWARSHITLTFKSLSGATIRNIQYSWAGNFTDVTNSSTNTFFWLYNDWKSNSWNLLFRNITSDFTVNSNFPESTDFTLSKITIKNQGSSSAPPAFYLDSISITSKPSAKEANIIKNGCFDEGSLDNWIIRNPQLSSTSAHGSKYGVYFPESNNLGYWTTLGQTINTSVNLDSSLYLHAWVYPELIGYESGEWNWAGTQLTFYNGTEIRYLTYTWRGSLELRSNMSTSYFISLYKKTTWLANQWNLIYRNIRKDFTETFGLSGIAKFRVIKIEFLTHFSNGADPGWFYLDSVGLYQSLTLNSGFENGLTDWNAISQHSGQVPLYPALSNKTVADGRQSLFVEQQIASPYNRGCEQSYSLTSYPLIENCYLSCYINPTTISNIGGNWPYSGIFITFNKSDNSESQRIYYLWAGDMSVDDRFFLVSDNWNVNEWNLLARNLYDDFKTGFPSKQPSNYFITKISIIYHYSDSNPGSFYVDNIDLFYKNEDILPPSITSTPNDQTYELGTIGDINLSWMVTDQEPAIYTIYRNDIVINSSSWMNGVYITEFITELPVGNYNFTIVISDMRGNYITDEVWVRVVDSTPPAIIIYPNKEIIFKLGTTFSLIWVATDLQPGNYTIYQDGIEIISKPWIDKQIINYTVDDLALGNHEIQIIFSDVKGNQADHLVSILIIDEKITEYFGFFPTLMSIILFIYLFTGYRKK